LIDTTLGREIDETNIRFTNGDVILRPLFKGNGTWVFTNLSREDFLMHISASGYEEADIDIKFDTLDPKLPMLDVFLMPSEKNRAGGGILNIYGTLPELEAIEAVYLNRPICGFSSVLEKRGDVILNLIPKATGGRINLESMKYALLSETKERYEVFEVLENETQTSVIIRSPLSGEHKVNETIYRIIYGRAGPDGRFSLKVRDDANSLPYLIRFTVNGVDHFRPVDFHLEHGEIDLMDGEIKVEPLPGKEEEEKENE
jgi:hypothetical protein